MFKNWTFKKHFIFSLILVIIVFYVLPIMGMGFVFLNIFWGSHEAGSIGIIGGADGPTAIFLAGKVVKMLWIPIVTFLGVLLLYIPIKLKEKTYEDTL